MRLQFSVAKYTDDQLMLAWYWFSGYPGLGYGETDEAFYRDMREKCIAERVRRGFEKQS